MTLCCWPMWPIKSHRSRRRLPPKAPGARRTVAFPSTLRGLCVFCSRVQAGRRSCWGGRRANLQGSLVVVPFYGESEAPDSVYFRQTYEDRYGRPPQTFAAYGYDAYRMVSSALRQGYTTPHTLGDALRSGVEVDAVTAIDAFSSLRVPARPPPVYEVRGAVLDLLP